MPQVKPLSQGCHPNQEDPIQSLLLCSSSLATLFGLSVINHDAKKRRNTALANLLWRLLLHGVCTAEVLPVSQEQGIAGLGPVREVDVEGWDGDMHTGCPIRGPEEDFVTACADDQLGPVRVPVAAAHRGSLQIVAISLP